jgi:mannose-6-phosphate isomerase-like protein (cupin superfamily)
MKNDPISKESLAKLIKTWQNYLQGFDNWRDLIAQTEPKENLCGAIYAPPNPLCRENESFAIADMTNIKFAYPHYHSETEIYFILQGKGLVVVGGEENYVEKNSVVVIPGNTAHFTIPKEKLVLAVVSTPPYKGEHALPLDQDNPLVKYDQAQLFRHLYAGVKNKNHIVSS